MQGQKELWDTGLSHSSATEQWATQQKTHQYAHKLGKTYCGSKCCLMDLEPEADIGKPEHPPDKTLECLNGSSGGSLKNPGNKCWCWKAQEPLNDLVEWASPRKGYTMWGEKVGVSQVNIKKGIKEGHGGVVNPKSLYDIQQWRKISLECTGSGQSHRNTMSWLRWKEDTSWGRKDTLELKITMSQSIKKVL